MLCVFVIMTIIIVIIAITIDEGVPPVFDRIPLVLILVENIPLAMENFLIMSPFLCDFKEF